MKLPTRSRASVVTALVRCAALAVTSRAAWALRTVASRAACAPRIVTSRAVSAARPAASDARSRARSAASRAAPVVSCTVPATRRMTFSPRPISPRGSTMAGCGTGAGPSIFGTTGASNRASTSSLTSVASLCDSSLLRSPSFPATSPVPPFATPAAFLRPPRRLEPFNPAFPSPFAVASSPSTVPSRPTKRNASSSFALRRISANSSAAATASSTSATASAPRTDRARSRS
mmetsp:Transcript_50490/g.155991  ORF Transcript_50490/g.155991 Transcript_50490/m.155991 type:complete len:232 (+) Transcript_50490:514-1209(+)